MFLSRILRVLWSNVLSPLPGLITLAASPTASAVGCTLSPLRGYSLAAGCGLGARQPGKTPALRLQDFGEEFAVDVAAAYYYSYSLTLQSLFFF